MSQSVMLNGMVVRRAMLRLPYSGVWTALVDLDQAQDDLTGSATLIIGEATYVGTFIPALTGTFQQQSKAFVVGGAAGWRQTVGEKHYHSDSGINPRLVIDDLAAIVGETLSSVVVTGTLGIDHTRIAGCAGGALTAACNGTSWWVRVDGKTNVGTRSQSEATAYEVLDFDARFKVATVVAQDISTVAIGSVLRTQLKVPLFVKGIEADISPSSLRLYCWGEEVAA